MIDVPRDLIRSCAATLSRFPSWKKRPCASCKHLIYGLNGIVHNFKYYRYHNGFPRPAQAIRELEGIRSLALTASRTGNTGPLLKRIQALRDRCAESYNMLVYRMAAIVLPSHPERAVIEQATEEQVLEIVDRIPDELASMADALLILLYPETRTGRGGNRNKGALLEREVLFDIGCLFHDIAKRPPGVTFSSVKREFTGPFLQFAGTVFRFLDLNGDGDHLFRVYQALDVPEWDRQRKKRVFRSSGP